METALVKRIDARGRGPREVLGDLRQPEGFMSPKYRDVARAIVADVRERGDSALLEYTERFSGARPDPVRVPEEDIRRAREALAPDLEESFLVAIENVRRFHRREMGRGWEFHRNGATVGQRLRPLR